MNCNDYKCKIAGHDCEKCEEYFEDTLPEKVTVSTERYLQLLDDSIKATNLYALVDSLTKDGILNGEYIPEYLKAYFDTKNAEKRGNNDRSIL